MDIAVQADQAFNSSVIPSVGRRIVGKIVDIIDPIWLNVDEWTTWSSILGMNSSIDKL